MLHIPNVAVHTTAVQCNAVCTNPCDCGDQRRRRDKAKINVHTVRNEFHLNASSFLYSFLPSFDRLLVSAARRSSCATDDKNQQRRLASQHRENPQLARQHLPSSTLATLMWYGMSWNLQGKCWDIVEYCSSFTHQEEGKEEEGCGALPAPLLPFGPEQRGTLPCRRRRAMQRGSSVRRV